MRFSTAIGTIGGIVLLLSGCGDDEHEVQCVNDTICNRFDNGECLAYEPTGHKWCVYPDVNCDSGKRWSDLDVGDGLSGMCVGDEVVPDGGPDSGEDAGIDGGEDGGDGPEGFNLSVSVGGSGNGSVTSTPDGIDCGTDCQESYSGGTQVALTATPESGSIFLGWGGACTGTGECAPTITEDIEVEALFGLPGENLWVDQVGSAGVDRGSDITSDAGNVYVIGTFTGTVNIGGDTLTSAGGIDAYVAKLSRSDGSAVWSKRLGGTSNDEGGAIAVDGDGNVIVAGIFQGTANFGGGIVTSAGSNDIFLAKYSGADGSHLWSERFGGTGPELAKALSTDTSNNIVVGGTFRNSVSFGGTTFTSAGADDAFVAKYSGNDGAHLWSKGMGGTSTDSVRDLVIDGSNNVVTLGEFNNTVDFGGGTKTSAGSYDVFVAKYSSTGTHLFSQRYGSTGLDSGAGIDVDAAGAMFIVGRFEDTVSFGGTALVATSGSDVFLVKLSLAGAHIWSKGFGGTSSEIGNDVAVDPNGDPVITGDFYGTINFGGGNVSSTATGTADAYVARFSNANGAHEASMRLGGTGHEVGGGISVSNGGDLFVTGQFEGFSEFGSVALTSAGMSDAFVLALAPI